MFARFYRDRRRAQSGTTLVELLVSVMVMGIALVLIVGTFSTGLLDAALAKRNTAAEAVLQYELDQVSGSAFTTSPASYSECFATESPTNPVLASAFQSGCPSGVYTLRADVACIQGCASNVQLWQFTVSTWPNGSPIGSPISSYKVNR